MSIIRQSRTDPWLRPPFAMAIGAAMFLALALVGPVSATGHGTDLFDAQVSPRTGSPTTTITFSVTYRDAHGDAPDAVNVVIDGAARSMTAGGGSNFSAGVRYGLATTLPAGVHLVAFAASRGASAMGFAPAGIVTIKSNDSGGSGTGGTGGGAPGGGTPGGNGTNGGNGSDPVGGGGTGGGGTGGGSTGDTPVGGGTGAPSPAAPAVTPAPTSSHGTTGGSSGNGAHAPTPTPRAVDHPKTKSSPGAAAVVPTAKASNDVPTAAPDMPVASADPAGDSLAIALGTVPGPTGSGGAGSADQAARGTWAGGGSGSRDDLTLADPTRAALGLGGITTTERMVIVAISTTTTTTTIMAFILFGKRRRDGEPPAPDEVLSADAARLMSMPSSALVPAFTTIPGPAMPGDEDGDLPRWRRPSLLAARKADPLRSTAASDTLTFSRGAEAPAVGEERRRIRYRIVSLLDAPDELRSSEIGFLDEGDEVQLLERAGSYCFVVCPDGSRGWLHRMTLGDVVGEKSRGSERVVDAPAPFHTVDDDGDGDDLLGDYLRLRHQS